MIVLLLLLGQVAWGQVGSLTITELTGSTQTSRPFTISRFFKSGDIANYPRPRVGGSALSTWQSDVKTRWRDTTTAKTVTGASNATPIVLTFSAAHGVFSTETITCSGVGGNTNANGTFRVTVLTSTTLRLRGTSGNGAWTSGGTCTVPTYGSVQHALISFTNTITGSGSLTVDFQNDSNPCSSGNQAACDAASLDQSGMLGFNGSTWGGKIEGVASSITKNASARTMMGAGRWRWWLRGPVVSQVIVEDQSTSRTDDFGWSCATNCSGSYGTATWTSDTTNRSLHPLFVVTFYAGWAGVRVEAILENMWRTKLQDQKYALTVYGGNAETTSKYTNSTFVNWAKTRWRREYWDGTEPGKVKIDPNLAYMRTTKAVPYYDTSVTCGSTCINNSVNYYTSKDSGAFYGTDSTWNGSLSKYQPGTGGRDELGLFPTWLVAWLYTGHRTNSGTSLWDVATGNAEVLGYIPIHVMEDNTSGSVKFCALSQTCKDAGVDGENAFGHLASRDPYTGRYSTTTVGNVSTDHGWTYDIGHWPGMVYAVYLVTGDYFFLRQFMSAAGAHLNIPQTGKTRAYYGGDEWGHLPYHDQFRSQAWYMRDIAQAATITPDALPEKYYFREKMLNNIAIHEGRLNVTGGFAYSTDSSDAWYDRWQWGYGQGSQVSDIQSNTRVNNPIQTWGYDEYASKESVDTGVTLYVLSPWMLSYLTIALNHAGELGFPLTGLLTAVNGYQITLLNGSNPYQVGSYRAPALATSGSTWFSSFSALNNGFSTSYTNADCGSAQNFRALVQWPQCNESNIDQGYPAFAYAASSWFPSYSGGTTARSWMETAFTQESNFGTNPKWALLPRPADSGEPIVPRRKPAGRVSVTGRVQ